MGFNALIDRLIHRPTRERASAEERQVLRTLAGVGIALFLSAFGLGVTMHTPLPLLCCGTLTAAVGAVLLRLRLTGQRRHSGTVLWVCLLALNLFSGLHDDGLYAYVSPSLVVIVLLAAYLEGVREVFVSTGLAIAAVPVLYWAHRTGHTLTPFDPSSDAMSRTLTNGAFWLACAAALIWVKHSSRERALRELADALARVKESEAARERAETDLRLAQKLEAVGRLAAGISHEINTPMQFIGDSVKFGREAFGELSVVFDSYRRLEEAVAGTKEAQTALEDLADAKELADFDYTLAELPSALARAGDGVLRVAQIVRSVKDFAQPDKLTPAPADLNRAIRSTLTLAHSEYHDVADVQTALADLPPVTCVLSEVNQVVLHLVVNAAHAIAEKNQGSSKRGTITVKTSLDADHAIIAVTDDGGGIPVQLQPMIFNPFFTTKEVGRGRGQGLAIARTVVTKQHGGSLTFDSAPGVGTTFYVRLPVRAPQTETPAG